MGVFSCDILDDGNVDGGEGARAVDLIGCHCCGGGCSRDSDRRDNSSNSGGLFEGFAGGKFPSHARLRSLLVNLQGSRCRPARRIEEWCLCISTFMGVSESLHF